ncbi:MAG: YicC family protein, partial [Mycobacterium leprae]
MIRSMTGFGRGEAAGEAGRIVVELKAVNHRFSEVVFRMPRQFNSLEESAKRQVLERVSRGRVDGFVSWEPTAEAKGVKVDKALAIAYYSALKELGGEIRSNSEISLDTLARLPDVLKVEDAEVTPEMLAPTFESAIAQAVDALLVMREREGAALAKDLLARIDHIEQIRQAVLQRAPLVVEEYRVKLSRRLEELLGHSGSVDPQRLAQEVAIFADRSDITEE